MSLNSRRESNKEEEETGGGGPVWDLSCLGVKIFKSNLHPCEVGVSGVRGQRGYFTKMCSASEAGSSLRLVDLVYHSTLGLNEIKEKQKKTTTRWGPTAVVPCGIYLV